MIIFINGPFGVGKTTVARRLVKRVPHSLFFDPEWSGYVIRRTLHRVWRFSDYQHDPLWRRLTVLSVRLLLKTGRPLVIPMNIWRVDYFEEIVGGLRRMTPHVYHFTLMASPETLHARLVGRGDGPGTFAFQHIEPSLAAFASPLFEIRIATDGKTIDKIVEEVLNRTLIY